MTAYIDAHLTHLRAAGRAARTILDRGAILRRVDVQLPLGLIRATTRELEHWLATPGWRRWTLCTYHMHLRGFFRWACGGRDPWLDWNPMLDIGHPRVPKVVPRPITDAQLERALAESCRQWQLIILLAAGLGLRSSEIARTTREDITADLTYVRGKGDKVATLPTHPLIWAVVEPMPPGPLVTRKSSLPATGRWLSIKARAHFDGLGMPDVHLHRIRHWYGTTSQRLQGDLRVTQELMRHSTPGSTAGYTQVTAAQRQTVAALPIPAPRRSPETPAASPAAERPASVPAPPRCPPAASGSRSSAARPAPSRS